MANRTLIQLDTVATSSVTPAAVFVIQDESLSDPNTRQLSLEQLSDLVVAEADAVVATSSGVATAAGTVAFTGTSSINTGLTVASHVIVSLKGSMSSSAASVSWSALASSGWFQGRVYANPVSSSEAPVVSTIPATVSWIAVGSL